MVLSLWYAGWFIVCVVGYRCLWFVSLLCVFALARSGVGLIGCSYLRLRLCLVCAGGWLLFSGCDW